MSSPHPLDPASAQEYLAGRDILVAAGLMFIVAPILPLVIAVGLTIWFLRRGRRPAPAPATTP